MTMGRLLSPNETKFWLMDWTAPMNSVVVLRCTQAPDLARLQRPANFRLPGIALDANDRPRFAEPRGDGVAQEAAGDDRAWLAAAERLAHVRVGTQGHPAWHAAVVRHAQGADVVLAVHHALTDYRSGLWVAHCLLEDRFPGEIAPACEELLAASAFGDPEAADLVEQWWLARASTRWHAIGLQRLAAFLPPPCATRLAAEWLTEDETEAFQARCKREGATPNGAVAVALRDVLGAARVAHSVDLSRFIEPEPDAGPGLAISHVQAEVDAGEFWEAARDVRATVFEAIASGAAGDELLVLPRALLREAPERGLHAAAVTITGAPTLSRHEPDYARYAMRLVVGSPRAGGQVVILAHDGARQGLIASSPADAPDPPLADLLGRLRQAVAA